MSRELLESKELKVLSTTVRTSHDRFIAGGAGLLEEAVKAGHSLRDAKLGIRHGGFTLWVESECGIAARTARTYMLIAQKHDREEIGPLALLAGSIQKALEAEIVEEVSAKPKRAAPTKVTAPKREAPKKPKRGDVETAIEVGGARFTTVLEELQRVRREIKQLADTVLCGEYLNLSEVDTLLKNAQAAVKFASPHARCVYCAKAGERQEGCRSCQDRGWLSRGLYDRAPAGLKRMVKGGGR